MRALEDKGVDILHRCGGFARCTTCRVELLDGEREMMPYAERSKREDTGLLGQVRLPCQISVDHDMHVKALLRLSESGLPDPGAQPEARVTPEPEWAAKPSVVRGN